MLRFFSLLSICFLLFVLYELECKQMKTFLLLAVIAREISKQGKPHVHCPCDKCNGRATWRMTAWRHLKSKREQSSQPIPVKKTRRTSEEPESGFLV